MRGPLLFADIDTPGLTSIETYRKGGGYETLAATVGVKPPDDVIEIAVEDGIARVPMGHQDGAHGVRRCADGNADQRRQPEMRISRHRGIGTAAEEHDMPD